MSRSRGRPIQYDTRTVLNAACNVFLSNGFSGTSLDQLSDAMQMNRPSIYNAFGDKQALYRRALALYCDQVNEGMGQTLFGDTDIRNGLIKFYDLALEVYYAEAQPMGCMMMCTAPAAAMIHPSVRDDLKNLLKSVDDKIHQRLAEAVSAKQVASDVDTRMLAKILQAVLHSLALRARAGETKVSLKKMSRYAVNNLL